MNWQILTTRTITSSRALLLRLAIALALVLFFAILSRAGTPKYVAGPTYLDASMNGQPVTWLQGQVIYYTDQGDLSPVLPNAAANNMVATAFAEWTSISTAAIAATAGGPLGEDVSGSNVIVNSDGTISIPADIQPTATANPVGIVYDYDGSVTDALIGDGAGDSSQCFFNAVFGGVDNFGPLANFQHALVVINGQCALSSSQLPDMKYRLVRVLGEVVGLGWSQVNLNVLTGHPPATSDDYAGFPVMHYTDPVGCVPITICYPNAGQPAMDDAAALSRLYPVTAQNQSSFPGKKIFSAVTARISGSLSFTGPSGTATQAMQGVNVVARWINPTTGVPSGSYAASAISGFLFTGNAGNPITGFDDALGNAFSDWGSSDQTVEGFFDLAGLEFPPGISSAQYQLSIEAVDPGWSAGVGPYAPSQVAPSGFPAPTTLTLAPGSNVVQNILMSGSEQPLPPWTSPQTWSTPAIVPVAGDWIGSLSGYGDVSYFSLPAQLNRTLSVAITALDESGNPTETKAQPVVGMWATSDPEGTPPPAFTSSPFNQVTFGLTRLDAQILSSASFVIGIADLRGDGRPDYRYHAHILYADTASPTRVSVLGSPLTVSGTGFATGLNVAVGSTNVTPVAVSAGQIIVELPPQSDGVQNIAITDPVSGASTVMTGVLTFGAAATDNILLLEGLNPPTPVGTQATNPVKVRVVAADGITPVPGATVGFCTTNSATLSACGLTPACGAIAPTSCPVVTDETGIASTWVTPGDVGTAMITATLAPGAYSTSPSVSGAVSGTSTASDIGVTTPYLWIAQGATVTLPLTARVVSNGAPKSGATVDFTIVQGKGSLSAASATTNSSGYASVNLTLAQITALTQISACVGPGNNPCAVIYANPVAASLENLQPVAGEGQIAITGQAFQPVVMRVTDSSTPPNPVIAAPVALLTYVIQPAVSSPASTNGDSNSGGPVTPVILSVSQTTMQTDVNGLASFVPTTGAFPGPLEVDVAATAGATASLEYILEALPVEITGSTFAGTAPTRTGRDPISFPVSFPALGPIRE